MSELPPESRPAPSPDADPTPTQAVPVDQPAATPQPAKQRLRDRLWSFRAVIAVALASVIVGGLGGAALAQVSKGGDDGRFGPGHGRFTRGGPGGPGGGPGNGNGGQQGRQQRPNGQGQGQFGRNGTPPGAPPTPAPSPGVPSATS